MLQLTDNDLRFVASRLPKDIRELLKANPSLFVAGGFIRAVIAGEEPADIDIFGPSKEILDATAKVLAEKRQGSRLVRTDNAITVIQVGRLPVQFITRWVFDSLNTCCASFDFTVCQAAIRQSSTWESARHDDFYSDLAARRLVYTAPVRNEDAGGSLLRVIKYVRKGYTVQVQSLGAVVSRLVQGIRQSEDGREMTEEWRAQVLTGLLREVDPLSRIDGFEMVDE